MQIYTLFVQKTKHGIFVRQPEFNLEVDADTLENAIRAIKDLIEKEGCLRLKNGETIPESIFDKHYYEKGTVLPNHNDNIVFVQVDIEKKFRDSASESVRKNISMPMWMDIMLRYYNVDASRLFQEAAQSFLDKQKEKEQINKKAVIRSVEDLEAQVDKKIIDQYILRKLT